MRIFALILALFFTTYAACEDFSKKQAKELAGAMLIVGFKGHLIDDPSVKIAQDALKEGKIGGVILFSSDTLQKY